MSGKQDVSQNPEALSVREGDSVDLNCSHTDSALYFLQWFRQDPGKGLTSLLSIQANQKEQTVEEVQSHWINHQDTVLYTL